MLFTTDLANIRSILYDKYEIYQKGSDFKVIFDVFGDGIFNAEGHSWRNQRRHAQVLLNYHQFRNYSTKTSKEKIENGLIIIMDHVANNGHVVDMQDVFQRLSFDKTCMFVTGYDPMSLSPEFPEVPFSKAMDAVEQIIFTRHVVPQSLWKLLRCLSIGFERKMMEAQETLNDVQYTYISRKRVELRIKGVKYSHENKDEAGGDLLTLYLTKEDKLLDLKNDDKFAKDIVLNHMLAARDMTSSALTWFLWLVITHPKVEAKIREELKAITPPDEAPKTRLFSDEELSNLSYLHAALSEALRLYPPVPFQHKEASEADILPTGHHVRPKLRVMVPMYAMARMVHVWGKDCWEFKPERWIGKDGSIKHVPPHKFLSFNAGPRTYLGKNVAYSQLKLVVAALIYNYSFQLVEGHLATPTLSMILYMKHGLKVRVRNR
ncbi:alkane hydroxylase MAH1-like [Apium graveolens]|uniref:alkane hydroxylase MAH1-like n=1 Tax=Apium graveolens TaxID=4045 RepID=UPI003D79C75F